MKVHVFIFIADSEKASSEADSEFEGSDPEESDEENDDYDDDNESHDFGVENDSFKHINTANISIEKKKGLCVKNQINLWENLLEMRIQLQKCLLVSNKMPQHDTYKELTSAGDEAFTSKLNETQKTVRDLLEKFLTLQSLLFKQYPETKSLLTQNGNGVSKERDEGIESDSNEEIPSDSDEETTNDCKDDKPDEETVFKSKRRKLSDYEAHLKDAHSKYKTYRDSTIQKWNDKTKVLSKSNDVTSVLKQIEYVLNDKEKLLQRTRQKKSNFEVLGKSIANAEGDNLEQQTDANEYDPEIFDDSDFYHQILRELIEFRSADLTDPVQLGRQWVQLQSMRSKMKRSIDTRATKGRKIRYAVHSKLVNFMAPMDDSKWTDAAKTDLYSSLFRGNQNIGVTSV